jgi:hypothetical protein
MGYSKFGLNHTLLCEDMLLSLSTIPSAGEHRRRNKKEALIWFYLEKGRYAGTIICDLSP